MFVVGLIQEERGFDSAFLRLCQLPGEVVCACVDQEGVDPVSTLLIRHDNHRRLISSMTGLNVSLSSLISARLHCSASVSPQAAS